MPAEYCGCAAENRFEVYQKETLPILSYFEELGKVITVVGQDDPKQSYQNMLDSLKTSGIAGLKEFVEG